MTNRMNIGNIIAKIRKEKGMQQGILASQVGITQASLSNIESGRTKRPSNQTLEPICNALGISVAELYIYAIESEDFPKEHKEKYDLILPMVKNLMNSVRPDLKITLSED